MRFGQNSERLSDT